MSFHAPQIIILILTAVGIGLDLERHGHQKTGKHNFWITFIASAVTTAILWWGGFFSK